MHFDLLRREIIIGRKQNSLCLLAIMFAILMLICSIPGVSATSNEPSVDERITAQAEAVEANEALMQYFYEMGWVTEYPDYFSGCYIEENILHIRLVLPTWEEFTALENILSNYKNAIVFEYSDYSQTSIQNYADETALKLIEEGVRVTYWYVEAESDNVIIGVVSDDVYSASTMVNEIQTPSRGKNPKIVIEEGAYTSATSDATAIAGSTMEMGLGS